MEKEIIVKKHISDIREEHDAEDIGSSFAINTEFRNMEQLYNAAIRTITMRFEILNGEFKTKYERNPIHHIEGRVKSAKSIANKLVKRNFPVSIKSAEENLNDIAGVRVVCSYIDDVYAIADMFLTQQDITLLSRQDYIKNPNFNGYRSLHLDVSVPLYLSDRVVNVKCEVQIRTVAMDLWASLEHDLRYKNVKTIPEEIAVKMLEESEKIAKIDEEMQEMYKKIMEL